MNDPTIQDRLRKAQDIIQSLEEELQAADHGLIALSAELEDRARKLERSEARFRALIENIGEGIAILDRDGTIRYVSAGFAEITGFSAEATIGSNAYSRLHPDNREAIERDWARVLEQPRETLSAEARFQHKSGNWRTIEVTAKNLLDEPAVEGVVATYRDITEQRMLERQFQQAQKMEAVGRLAGGVAHDFNNIITAIRGYAELAGEDLPAGTDRHASMQEIVRAAGRAADLTRQLLAFSRQQVTTPRVLEPAAVVRDTKTMLRRLIGDDVRLEIDISDDLGRVEADPIQIEQVLVNLAVNARDAMPGGGRLRIAAENAALDEEAARDFSDTVRTGRYVLISVSDTGQGIDPDTLKQVFEPFFTTKKVGEGTGLGLSTVYGIIKQAGGYIRVRSRVGEGTVFDIYLPRTDEEPEKPAAVEPDQRDLTGSETVLVVEDQRSIRSLARRSLERVGYRVLDASDGQEAIRMCEAENGKVDLLLTDVVMPGMGGPDLARRVLEMCDHEPRVIYMSGHGREQMLERGILEGSPHYLEKPFGISDLQRTVREVLDA